MYEHNFGVPLIHIFMGTAYMGHGETLVKKPGEARVINVIYIYNQMMGSFDHSDQMNTSYLKEAKRMKKMVQKAVYASYEQLFFQCTC